MTHVHALSAVILAGAAVIAVSAPVSAQRFSAPSFRSGPVFNAPSVRSVPAFRAPEFKSEFKIPRIAAKPAAKKVGENVAAAAKATKPKADPDKTAGNKTNGSSQRAVARPPKPKNDDVANNDPKQPPKGDKPPKDTGNRPKPPRIVVLPPPRVVVVPPSRQNCDGGRIQRNTCVCPKGEARIGIGDGAYRCGSGVATVPLPPFIPPVVSVPPPSRGGTIDPPRFVGIPTPPLPPNIQPPAARPPQGTPPQALPPALPPFAQLNEPVFVPDEIVITVASTAPQSIEDGVAQRFNLQLLERTSLPLLGERVIRLRIPDSRQVPAVVASLAAETVLGERQPNYIYRQQQGQPTLGFGDLQYALMKVGLSADVASAAAGKGAIISIIDTGVDRSHPDLALCDVAAFDAIGSDGDTTGSHGTAIAGIIAAQGITRGIAPGARLLSVRAFKSEAAGSAPVSTSYTLAKSFDWSVAQGARVLNLSFAGPRDPVIQKAVAATAAKDIVMIAAAGNNGKKASPAFPAAYPEVIAVTAIDSADRLYDKANQGEYISVAAPGVDIFAAAQGRGHDLQSGTSFAAAHVSGIVALMLARNPALTAAAARRALTDSAIDLGSPGRDSEFGAGLTNADAALKLVAARTP